MAETRSIAAAKSVLVAVLLMIGIGSAADATPISYEILERAHAEPGATYTDNGRVDTILIDLATDTITYDLAFTTIGATGIPDVFVASFSQVTASAANLHALLSGAPSAPAFFSFTTPSGEVFVLTRDQRRLVVNGHDNFREFPVGNYNVVENPEPGTLILLGSGLLGLAYSGRRSRARIVA